MLPGGVTEDERAESRRKLRAELREWIEARVPQFLAQCGDGESEAQVLLPAVEDFRLLICIGDAAGGTGVPDWYPTVDSGTAHHRQLGLTRHDLEWLISP